MFISDKQRLYGFTHVQTICTDGHTYREKEDDVCRKHTDVWVYEKDDDALLTLRKRDVLSERVGIPTRELS